MQQLDSFDLSNVICYPSDRPFDGIRPKQSINTGRCLSCTRTPRLYENHGVLAKVREVADGVFGGRPRRARHSMLKPSGKYRFAVLEDSKSRKGSTGAGASA